MTSQLVALIAFRSTTTTDFNFGVQFQYMLLANVGGSIRFVNSDQACDFCIPAEP